MKRFTDALAGYDKALALRPDDPRLISNRGNTLCELNRPAEAVAAFDRALKLKPDDPDVLNNRGNALLTLNRASEALTCYDRALAVRPRDAQTLINRGNALTDLRRPDDALASYDSAIAVAPDHAEAHWNKSLVLLSRGDFTRGFAEYEWRKRRVSATDKRDFAQPLWLGEADIAGKTVLLHAEQGYDDTIQFVRYAPLVAARGATVVLEVQASLKPLLSGLPGVSAVVGRGEPLPPFDLHCPLMSLPLAFRTTLDAVPAATPYVDAPPECIEKWKTRFRPTDSRSASSGPAARPTRTITTVRSRWASWPLCLAMKKSSSSACSATCGTAIRKSCGRCRTSSALGPGLQDFADTAAVISLLDLVIAVDTGVAHLAGALGKPVWLLLPFIAEWRWLEGCDDSPWYPAARSVPAAEGG